MSPATEIQLPQFGMGMGSGTVVQWLKAVGDTVIAGEPVVEVEAEKATVEVVAPVDGVLLDIQVPEGETVPVRTVLGLVGDPGTQSQSGSVEPPLLSSQGPEPPAAAPSADQVEPYTSVPASRPAVVPRARKMAKDHGIDAETLVGSGPEGRVTEDDVSRAIEQAGQVGSPGGEHRETGPPAGPADRVVPLSTMRRVIADRMHASLRDTAQLTIGYEVDAEGLVALRSRLANTWPVQDKPGYLDMVVAGVARALRWHPRLNATLVGEVLTEHGSVNIGIAVAVDDGLLVPVIRDADRLSLRELVRTRQRLVAAARRGRLTPDDLTGATFTVSSLGAEGVGFFTPVLNAPQVAILGVGAINDGVRWEGASPVRQRRMPLSLTIDHRAVDGAPAAKLLGELARILADPLRNR